VIFFSAFGVLSSRVIGREMETQRGGFLPYAGHDKLGAASVENDDFLVFAGKNKQRQRQNAGVHSCAQNDSENIQLQGNGNGIVTK
jgi:hypothetical protein